MNIKSSFFYLFLFTFSLTLSSCGDDDPIVDMEPQTIVDIASADAQFSTLVTALDRVGLVSTVQNSPNLTVFAPTNAAFDALGVDLNTVSDEALTEILLYHVIGAKINSSDLEQGDTYAQTAATTGPGGSALSVLVQKNGSNVSINNSSNVIQADIEASNGIIHVIDAVITPLDVVGHAIANSDFSQLVGALSAAPGNLVGVLSADGPFTVFAPVNSAFEEISDVVAGLTGEQLASVLTYHVVAGANVKSSDLTNNMMVTTVNGDQFSVNIGDNVTITDIQGNVAEVVFADVQATNGIIHVIDKVIIPQL
jgi:transforming growth factor-beta-induced protein